MSTFQLSVETDRGAYIHGFHLGCDRAVARACAEQVFAKIDIARVARLAPTIVPAGATRVVTVALLLDGCIFDVYDGGWHGDMLDLFWDAA